MPPSPLFSFAEKSCFADPGPLICYSEKGHHYSEINTPEISTPEMGPIYAGPTPTNGNSIKLRSSRKRKSIQALSFSPRRSTISGY